MPKAHYALRSLKKSRFSTHVIHNEELIGVLIGGWRQRQAWLHGVRFPHDADMNGALLMCQNKAESATARMGNQPLAPADPLHSQPLLQHSPGVGASSSRRYILQNAVSSPVRRCGVLCCARPERLLAGRRESDPFAKRVYVYRN